MVTVIDFRKVTGDDDCSENKLIHELKGKAKAMKSAGDGTNKCT